MISNFKDPKKSFLFVAIEVDWAKLRDLKLNGVTNFGGSCLEALTMAAPVLEALDLNG